ncbi:hypothetical protein DFA_01143 [Cavenderia fasciculata]|uniref:Nudix hydrolase domain-containing protein n=1 Tax=Cavenderia fasciculata TaxID=261658 RepID=F4PQZ9_CACFS|nr:uncharacterized protein DFA_01143 [Cavenderia fasciculata]EGG21264.1 hypothetical protein DFA_01143 [Cavenderia fasciculata]|eukprot:XP_004359114.1 hypothetical protein DFA_01143 [Cavenderia fasciculata]
MTSIFNNIVRTSKPQSMACMACGVLPYMIRNNEIFFLMGQENRGVSDFGGYCDESDRLFHVSASREFSEETMGLFCQSLELRGTRGGVTKSTETMTKILSNKELHKDGYVKEFINPKNSYKMFCAPTNLFVSSKTFQKTLFVNDNRLYKDMIMNVEKNTVWWITIDQLISIIKAKTGEMEFDGRTERLFRNFLVTIEQPEFMEFINNLKAMDLNQILQLQTSLWKDS